MPPLVRMDERPRHTLIASNPVSTLRFWNVFSVFSLRRRVICDGLFGVMCLVRLLPWLDGFIGIWRHGLSLMLFLLGDFLVVCDVTRIGHDALSLWVALNYQSPPGKYCVRASTDASFHSRLTNVIIKVKAGARLESASRLASAHRRIDTSACYFNPARFQPAGRPSAKFASPDVRPYQSAPMRETRSSLTGSI